MDVTCFEAQLKLGVIMMLLAQLPRPARFRPHEAALNNANQSGSAKTALSFITEASRERHVLELGDRERVNQTTTVTRHASETYHELTNHKSVDNAYRRYFGSKFILVVG